MIMPLLMKLMRWVTDNRALFVKWGRVIANMFEAVYNIVLKLWEVLKKLAAVVADALQKAFGTDFNSFEEFINTIMVKTILVTTMLGALAG